MKLIVVTMFLAFAGIASCQKAEPVKKFANDGEVPRISIDDAKKAHDAAEAVIVDARAADAYKMEHIAGSINIPLGSDASEFDKLPKGKKIIVYCS